MTFIFGMTKVMASGGIANDFLPTLLSMPLFAVDVKGIMVES